MDVSVTTWAVTLTVLVAVYVVDFAVAARRPHVVGMREAAVWVGVYAMLAALFGLWVAAANSWTYAGQFFAGWITEYSLSVDNLFVFVLIMASFSVPRLHQQKVLQLGILGALVLRFAFIMVGAAAINRFSSVFYLFGAFLLYTAFRLATGGEIDPGDPADSRVLRVVERVLPTTNQYVDGRFVARVSGRRVVTPLFVVIVAIFLTDLLFALDSIPAIFGLTREPYLVFTANAFALTGLRQLYFLLDGVLDRLVYLSRGLAVVLGFIGVKLVLHALHESGFHVPEIGTAVSLAVVVVVMTVTVVASLLHVRRHPEDRVGEVAHTHEGEALAELEQEAQRSHPDLLAPGTTAGKREQEGGERPG